MNSTYRKFGQDIDANKEALDVMNSELEFQLNSRNFAPTTVVAIQIKIEQTLEVIKRLEALRTELFPNGIAE